MNHRILVVEDNPLNLELLTEWLEAEGYEVMSTSDLKTSFAAVERHRPEAILLDVQLGAEDGLLLASWIRQQPALRHIPVIAVTAHALMSERDHILHSGCNAFIPKPIDFKLLQEQLKRWLPASR